MTPTEDTISPRAKAIADGLIRTKRAINDAALDQGMLRLRCKKGGYYWVSLNGSRVLRGWGLFDADELQPKFTAAMQSAGILPR